MQAQQEQQARQATEGGVSEEGGEKKHSDLERRCRAGYQRSSFMRERIAAHCSSMETSRTAQQHRGPRTWYAGPLGYFVGEVMGFRVLGRSP